MKSLLFALVTLIPIFAFAGDTETHGGHGVACKQNDDIKLETLDLFEARELYEIVPRPLSFALNHEVHWDERNFLMSVMEVARVNAIKALGSMHPFVQLFPDRPYRFKVEYRDLPIAATLDSGVAPADLPKNCRLVQIGVRQEIGSRVARFHVDEDLFELMSLENRGALLIHEVLHTWFGTNDDTLGTRQAVIYLTAPAKFRHRNEALFKKLVETRKPIRRFQK